VVIRKSGIRHRARLSFTQTPKYASHAHRTTVHSHASWKLVGDQQAINGIQAFIFCLVFSFPLIPYAVFFWWSLSSAVRDGVQGLFRYHLVSAKVTSVLLLILRASSSSLPPSLLTLSTRTEAGTFLAVEISRAVCPS